MVLVPMLEFIVVVPIVFEFIAELLFIRLTFTFVFESVLHPIIAALRLSAAPIKNSLLISLSPFSF